MFKNLKESFLDEFSSVRLAITLFIFLIITTLVGTILPQESMVGSSELINKYGPEKYKYFKSLGLTDVFHSWWYMALLTLLGINLIVCSIKRVFPTYRRAFSFPKLLEEENILRLPINCTVSGVELNQVENKLKEKKYKTRIINNQLTAQKGSWHRLGASVTHIGILVLLAGSLLATLTGFNGVAELSENEGFYMADLGQDNNKIKSSEPDNYIVNISKMPIWFGKIPNYLVKVNKTWREDYETGQPKQWYSDLSVYDKNKKELIRKTIFVNSPLEFMGLDIYQSSWGKFLEVSFNNEKASLPLENFKGKEFVFLPLSDGIGLKLEVDPAKNNSEMKLFAVMFDSKDSPVIEKLLGKMTKNSRANVGPMIVQYYGTTTLTGLQFKSNPGSLLIYPGLAFIIAGVFIAFGSKRQIWAFINPNENKLVIGGISDRAKGKFYEEFESLVHDIVHKVLHV